MYIFMLIYQVKEVILIVYGVIWKVKNKSCPMQNEPEKLIKVGYQGEIVQN